MNDKKPALNLTDTILIVSGSMIGSGIFIVSSEMAREVGGAWWLILCWIFSGVLTLFAALSYGELAGMMPEAGGQYAYIKKAFGEMTAFMYGWTVFLVIQTGVIAAVAMAFAKYFGVFIPFFDDSNTYFKYHGFSIGNAQLLAILSILFLTWLNTKGIRNGRTVQRIFTFAKLAALGGIILTGIYAVINKHTLSENFRNGWEAVSYSGTEAKPLLGFSVLSAVCLAMIGSLFSSDAWNNVTFIAKEIQSPKKNIPLGLAIGTLMVTIIYVLANLSYLSLLNMEEIRGAAQDRVGTAAISKIMDGSNAIMLMAGLIIISTFGCNNGLILAGSRLFKAMADEGLFFRATGKINSKGVPGNSLWIQALWASVLCLSGSYSQLLEYSTFASLLFYLVTISGLFILRKREPNLPRPYKAFGYPVVPGLYLFFTSIVCIVLLVYHPSNSLAGIGIALLGIPVYFIIKKTKKTIVISRISQK